MFYLRALWMLIMLSLRKSVEKSAMILQEPSRDAIISYCLPLQLLLLALVKSVIKAKEYLINPAGEWSQGGFDADSGLTGRKLVIDNYGPEVAIGGGSFSGKDYTKVDRSGAYMARRIAVDLLRKYQVKGGKGKGPEVREVHTKLAYAIGKKDPVMAVAVVVLPGGKTKELEITGYDLSPSGIRKCLALDKVKFVDTCRWGHFGNGFSWD